MVLFIVFLGFWGHARGRAENQLQRIAGCIERGLNQVEDDLPALEGYVETVRFIQATLEPTLAPCVLREQQFEGLGDRLRFSDDPVEQHMGKVMASFHRGLFVGGDDADQPRDNLDLERWFRQPKGHERRIHGHKHAGVRIVQEGPTLVHVLDVHLRHPDRLTSNEILPYLHAEPPASQHRAIVRRKVMRRARSEKARPLLLAELELRVCPKVEKTPQKRGFSRNLQHALQQSMQKPHRNSLA